MTLEALIDRYNEMLQNFVRTEDAIKEQGIDVVRQLGIIPPESEATQQVALAILTAFQTALVNVMNDLETVLAAQKEGV